MSTVYPVGAWIALQQFMLIAIHSTPGLGRVISRLEFPPDVIVLPRCETFTISDTIRIAIGRMKQLDSFSNRKKVVCIDWFEAPEDATDIERAFLKVHANTLADISPHTCHHVFLDIEPRYAFEMLIREGSTIQGTGRIERPDRETTRHRVVRVAPHEFDTQMFRARIVKDILNSKKDGLAVNFT